MMYSCNHIAAVYSKQGQAPGSAFYFVAMMLVFIPMCDITLLITNNSQY